MKYVKKRIPIEAVQWNKHGDHPSVRKTHYMEISDMLGTMGCSREEPYWSWDAMGVIDTLEGKHVVVPGDWVITGIKDEVYPCKNDIFLETYEVYDERD